MESSLRLVFLVLLIALRCPCKFIQSPPDFGPLNFLQGTNKASLDFGRIVFNSPSAVLRPRSARELCVLLSLVSTSPTSNKLTVAARGAGHSIHGQAQAVDGIVVEMDALPTTIEIHDGEDEGEGGLSYADVSGGTLWIELLEESLKHGLAPRSWTDYLYLSIGGTLSNGGISGQTFKYGPQISNVLQLDVVIGTGELMTCSPTERSELFHAVLGGLGQFGIITNARIVLQPAPPKVKWVRAFYDDFEAFTGDQELLVSMPGKVDYVEGFLVLNEQSLHSSSIAFPSSHVDFAHVLHSDSSKLYYCLEFAVHVYQGKASDADQALEEIREQLSYMGPHVYVAEVSYYDFLNRVKLEEMNLRSKGLWDVPHPWLNMFVPKPGIARFKDLLLENISKHDFVGPVLIYPILKDKWDANTSAVLPDSPSNVLYIVGILRSAVPASCSTQCLRDVLQRNRRVVHAATDARGRVGAKQYLAHHAGEGEWRRHFGDKWELFSSRKSLFDPLCILSPGPNIFQRRPYGHQRWRRSPYAYSA